MDPLSTIKLSSKTSLLEINKPLLFQNSHNTMLLSSKSISPISCNFPSIPRTHTPPSKPFFIPAPKIFKSAQNQPILRPKLQYCNFHICHDSANQEPKIIAGEEEDDKAGSNLDRKVNDGNDWSTSILLFGFWAGVMFYVFKLAPDQTPYRDMYFLQKLLNLKGDDGFQMNEVLVALWYIMGLWPLVYSMLLLPSARSSKSKIPVWPFLVLSCFGGAYALIPYFVLWKPPPPPVGEDEITKWPLNFLESKITAALSLAAGLGLITYAGFANADAWKEFYQYFRESKFIHATCVDFSLLSAFAPFWVYNDMTARKWTDKGSWLLPVSLIPFVGPSLYLLLRPSLSALPTTENE